MADGANDGDAAAKTENRLAAGERASRFAHARVRSARDHQNHVVGAGGRGDDLQQAIVGIEDGAPGVIQNAAPPGGGCIGGAGAAAAYIQRPASAVDQGQGDGRLRGDHGLVVQVDLQGGRQRAAGGQVPDDQSPVGKAVAVARGRLVEGRHLCYQPAARQFGGGEEGLHVDQVGILSGGHGYFHRLGCQAGRQRALRIEAGNKRILLWLPNSHNVAAG